MAIASPLFNAVRIKTYFNMNDGKSNLEAKPWTSFFIRCFYAEIMEIDSFWTRFKYKTIIITLFDAPYCTTYDWKK